MLNATPPDLRKCIQGETDSEHAFFFWLANLSARVGDAAIHPSMTDVLESLVQTVRMLAEWFPSYNDEETKMNFMVTDGNIMAALRWRHSLFMLSRPRSHRSQHRNTKSRYA